MRLCAALPAEHLLAEVGNFAVNIKILSLKVIQLVGERKHFGAQSGAYLKMRGAGVIIELADFVGGIVGVVADGNFDEFRCAGLEDAAKAELSASGCRRSGAGRSRVGRSDGKRTRRPATTRAKSENRQKERSRRKEFHRVDSMREGAARVAPRAALAAVDGTRDFARAVDSVGRPKRKRACSACAWQSATAKASAASAGSGISVIDSSARTMSCIWRLSAWPYPATDALTSRGE